jgi:hypothetical protein
VCRFSDSIRLLRVRYRGLPGAGTLNHGGFRALSGRTSGPRISSTFWFPPGLALDRVAIPPRIGVRFALDWNTLSHKQRFEQDRVRDERLTAAGWTVIRTTWKKMTRRPHELRSLLLKLLAPASPNALG